MPYKIALASSDSKTIDLHFSQLKSLAVYSVDEGDESFSFIEERRIEFSPAPSETPTEGGCRCAQGFAEKVAEICADCQYLLVAKIGNKMHRALQERGVNCIESPYPIPFAIPKLNAYYVRHKKRESHAF